MWFVETMRVAGFDARSRQPAFHYGFGLVDLQEHRGMDVNRAVTNHKSAPSARFWLAIARDSKCPSGRRVVIIAILLSSMRL
jgi:hypothetical protein